MTIATEQKITYLIGDASRPVFPGPKIIPHVCNDAGGYGAGFAAAIRRHYPKAQADYHRQHTIGGWALGNTQFVPIDGTDIVIANMIAQHGYKSGATPVPLNYGALHECLVAVRRMARWGTATVHMPRIGSGLAGGKWEKIADMIEMDLVTGDDGVPVFVYDLQRS